LSGDSIAWSNETGRRAGLKTMGKDFLAGYLNIADGEKDPRNLLLAFSIVRVLLIEFDISSYVEVCSSTTVI
jgi:DNA repair/transcription protein MET18/MMS19